jgi:hypothetical protein
MSSVPFTVSPWRPVGFQLHLFLANQRLETLGNEQTMAFQRMS